MKYNVGLDLGNNFVKVISGKHFFSFPARLQTGIDEFSEADKINVVYDDVGYSIGTGNYNLLRDKYFQKSYKIMLLTALAKITAGNAKSNEYNIVISLPVDEFKNKKLKNEIKEMVKSWGSEKITVEGVERIINIDNFEIFCEGCIISLDLDNFKDKDVIVVDIGGYTWDLIGFHNLKRENSSSENKGVITLKDSIYQKFKEKYFVNLGEEEKERFFKAVINSENYKINDEIVDTREYQAFIDNYIIEIFNKINRTFDINNKEIFFIGGGSIELKNYLENHKKNYKFSILKNADMLNAYSNYNYCIEIFKMEGK